MLIHSSSLLPLQCFKHSSQKEISRYIMRNTLWVTTPSLVEPFLWKSSQQQQHHQARLISSFQRQPLALASVIRSHNMDNLTTTIFMKSSFTKTNPFRALRSSSSGGNTQETTRNPEDGKVKDVSQESTSSTAIVMTPGEKVVAASRLTMYAFLLCLSGACAYFIIKELSPSKMSPNRVFDTSFQVVRKDPEVKRQLGGIIKAYGKDFGGHREGRRNFVEHTEYVNSHDGSNRTRVRYNLEAKNGDAFVFAEVSSKMKSNEFVYILVQNKRTGSVITVIDNRAAIMAEKLAGDNKEGFAAMTQLLTGGKKN